jgi:hypothetical protein
MQEKCLQIKTNAEMLKSISIEIEKLTQNFKPQG